MCFINPFAIYFLLDMNDKASLTDSCKISDITIYDEFHTSPIQ